LALIRLLITLLLIAPLVGVLFTPKFRRLRLPAQLAEAGLLYAGLGGYLFCNMLHSLLDLQKGIGNGLFDLPASFLTGVALGLLAVAAGVAWFVLVPYRGK
jgi:hypothetical protein